MKTLEEVFLFILIDTVLPVLLFAGGFYSIWFGAQIGIANPPAIGVTLIVLGVVCRVGYKWIEICLEEVKK